MMKQTKGCIRIITCVSLLAGLGLLATAPAPAAITPVGQLSPSYDSSDPWIINDDLLVGTNADGSLTVSAGGDVSNLSGFLGFAQNVTGTVTVTGLGSSWDNSDLLSVGGWGTGDLRIEDQALVTANEVQIAGYAPVDGYETLSDYLDPSAVLPEGVGTITVTEAGRLESDGLSIGFWGDGTLDVNDGGEVVSGWAELGVGPNATGTATVDGSASTWTIDNEIVVGAYGEGDLTIANGGEVSAYDVYVGGAPLELYADSNDPYDPDLLANGTGILTVTGAGSLLDATGDDGLFVGYSGNGTLDVNEGGQVEARAVIVGAAPDAIGTVTVDGAGSALSVEDDMLVGFWGQGDLMVTNGGQVTVGEGLVIGGGETPDDLDPNMLADFGPVDGIGTVTVTGAGSTLDVLGDDTLIVGSGGTGTLTVSDGGAVTAVESFVGGYVTFEDEGATEIATIHDGTGTATVTGSGSTWDNEILTVGAGGHGVLDVLAGGAVSTNLGIVGLGPDSTGTVQVSGPGSVLNVLDANDPEESDLVGTLVVGAWGDGTLTISNGGDVNAVTVYVGGGDPNETLGDDTVWNLGDPAGTGTVTVTGAGSQLDVEEVLHIGYSGEGTLDVLNGGQVLSGVGVVGALAAGDGEVTVDGAGSTWSILGGAGDDPNLAAEGEGYVDIANGGQINVQGDDALLMVADTITVGSDGTGSTLTISNGGEVTDNFGLISNEVGGSGAATVSGSGSLWTHTGGLGVGIYGQGDLLVEDGGQVTSLESGIAIGAGSVGTVDVTGAGSLWDNTEELAVGVMGTGTLTISGGGQVTNTDAFIGGLDPDAPNIDVSFILGDTLDGTGTVRVTGTGSRWDNSGDLYVGYTGTGTLDVNDGAVVTSEYGAVGADPNSVGTVTVADAGSQWSVSEGLAVGGFGQGDLTVSAGGRVDANEVYIGGFDPDALGDDVEGTPLGTGTVTVTGSGSQLNVDDFLYVGYTGTGTLDVNAAGSVSSEYGGVGADPNSTGTVTVTGAGSVWDVDEALAVGAFGTGYMTIADGGQVNAEDSFIAGFDPSLFEGVDREPNGTGGVTVTGAGSLWANSGNLTVGFGGVGEMLVEAGGQVTSADGAIGAAPAGDGTVTVTGAGSSWTMNDAFSVGGWGTGTLTIADGGEVTNVDGYIGGFRPSAFGIDPNVVGYDPNGTGTVTVTGTGSQWTNSGDLNVGFLGDGTLTISDGGLVDAVDVFVGEYTTGTVTISAGGAMDANTVWIGRAQNLGDGVVTVTGSGSTLDANDIYVGAWGQGELTISDGAEVSNTAALIGSFWCGTGMATVTGTGSLWEMTGALSVGYAGQGTMTISGGGVVDSGEASIGYTSDSVGEVTVTGTGSAWTPSDLSVGRSGEGHLTIGAGGEVTTGSAILGQMVDGTGEVLVTGAGSQLDIPNTLWVGYRGEGSLTIADGAQVDSRIGVLGEEATATGTVLVTGESSEWVLGDDLFVGYAGTGSVDVNDGGRLVVDESLYIGGDETGSGGTGTVMITDGADALIGEELYVWETGTLGGDGTISIFTPTTLHNYGTIAPGDGGIGTLSVEGNVVFEPNSVFEVEIGNSGADQLMVDGDVTINGGTVQVQSAGTVVGSREYDIIEADSVTGTFDVLDTALLDFYFNDAGLDYDASTVTLWIDAMQFDDPNLTQTYNQQQVGGAFQEIAGDGGNDVTAALQELPEFDDVRDAYDQLAGRTRPSLAPISVAGTARFMGTVSHRLRNPGAIMGSTFGGSSLSAKAGPDAGYSSSSSYEINTGSTSFAVGNGSPYLSDSKWGFWAKGYGLFGTRDGSDEAPGYDYTTYGVGFGLDHQFTDTLLLGLTGGYSDGDVDYDGSPDSSELSATHLGVYGSWDAGSTYVDSLLTYSDLDYETQRYVELTDERLEGDFGGYAVSGYFETGFDWRKIHGWQLQPLASFQFSYMDLDNYTESGGDAALGYDDQTYESYIGSLGTKVTRNLLKDSAEKRLVAQFRARWLHEFGDTRSDVNTFFASDPTTIFSIRDSEIARDSAVLGVGLAAQLNSSTRLYVDYDTRLNADDTAHLISGGLQYRW